MVSFNSWLRLAKIPGHIQRWTLEEGRDGWMQRIFVQLPPGKSGERIARRTGSDREQAWVIIGQSQEGWDGARLSAAGAQRTGRPLAATVAPRRIKQGR
jgi:hypothetical protein